MLQQLGGRSALIMWECCKDFGLLELWKIEEG